MTIVRTTAGEIKGYEKDGIHYFKGVPFAAPPVGDLRFAPPQPPVPWEGTAMRPRTGRSARRPCSRSKVPSRCDLRDAAPGRGLPTLTVTTPAVDGSLPVMVWIHGGAFTGGSGSTPIYDGTSLRDGVVSCRSTIACTRSGSVPRRAVRGAKGTGNLGILDRCARVGARQHRRVRWRSEQRHDLRRVGRRHERRHAHGHTERERALRARSPNRGGQPQHEVRDRDPRAAVLELLEVEPGDWRPCAVPSSGSSR